MKKGGNVSEILVFWFTRSMKEDLISTGFSFFPISLSKIEKKKKNDKNLYTSKIVKNLF